MRQPGILPTNYTIQGPFPQFTQGGKSSRPGSSYLHWPGGFPTAYTTRGPFRPLQKVGSLPREASGNLHQPGILPTTYRIQDSSPQFTKGGQPSRRGTAYLHQPGGPPTIYTPRGPFPQLTKGRQLFRILERPQGFPTHYKSWEAFSRMTKALPTARESTLQKLHVERTQNCAEKDLERTYEEREEACMTDGIPNDAPQLSVQISKTAANAIINGAIAIYSIVAV